MKNYKVKFAKDFTDGNVLPEGKVEAGKELVLDEVKLAQVQASDPEALEPTARLVIPRSKKEKDIPPGHKKQQDKALENPPLPGAEEGDGLVGQKPPGDKLLVGRERD